MLALNEDIVLNSSPILIIEIIQIKSIFPSFGN